MLRIQHGKERCARTTPSDALCCIEGRAQDRPRNVEVKWNGEDCRLSTGEIWHDSPVTWECVVAAK
ncbi:hypothetical protein CDL15_Pgr011289 [Punica granatum]|uniref:Uncharacterized protein n=1 Tax=Punica granatum TaxID=22663 RepID=A0A218WGK8_PUNGR|nr:hypothetical protein CDL15_Pgr011289 [Punica granatum]